MFNLIYIYTALLAILIGGIPTGKIIIYLLKKIDIQKIGSGNIGSTNVARVAGLRWGVVVFILDALKAYLLVLTTSILFNNSFSILAWVGALTVFGNIFSVYLKFKGGKGVSASFGVLFYFSPLLITIAALSTLFIAYWRKQMSVGTFSGIFTILILYIIFEKFDHLILVGCLSILVIFAHRTNIYRLIKGQEMSIGKL